MRTLIAVLLWLAASGPAALAAEPVSLPGPEGITLRALLALPPGGARGATVIALHGCTGLAPAAAPLRLPRREADWAALLNDAGHPVLFPDSFGSRGLGSVCGRGNLGVAPARVRRDDALAAAAWAAAQPWSLPGGVVLLGWSHGGSTTLAAAAAPLPPGLLRAAIAFYPGCGVLQRRGDWAPAVPLLMLLGDADDWTPPGACRALAAAWPATVRMESHPGAHHGFDAPDQPIQTRTLPDGRMVTTGTDPAARADARRLVPAFLQAHAGVAR